MNTLFGAIIVALIVYVLGLLIGRAIWGNSENS
jgi:hypothetical protein